MNEQLGKIPFVHMENGLDYVFKFAGKSHKVSQKNHYQHTYEQTLRYAKKHAMRVFYVHHLKRGRLPQIIIKDIDSETYSYHFNVEGGVIGGLFKTSHIGYADEYTQAFDYAIYKVLYYYEVDGVIE